MRKLALALALALALLPMPALADEPEDMPAFYARQISATELKIYAKDIVGIGKVSIRFNGREVGWVRASSASDRKLRIIDGTAYLVRSVKLRQGVNKVDVFVNDQRAWFAEY